MGKCWFSGWSFGRLSHIPSWGSVGSVVGRSVDCRTFHHEEVWIQSSTVLTCCVLEQDTLSVLLNKVSCMMSNGWEQPCCRAMSSLRKISLKTEPIFSGV